MASKGKSRWADDEEDSNQIIAQRKREKEEKKRAKQEKLRKVEAQQDNAQTSTSTASTSTALVNGDVERPWKRRKFKDETEKRAEEASREGKVLAFPLMRFRACRNVEEYEHLNEIEEGSYGLVSRAREKATSTVVALKKLKMDYTNDGFPVTGLREIQTLMAARHPHIVHLREVVMGSTLKE